MLTDLNIDLSLHHWMGLNDIDNEALSDKEGFVWSDGSPFTFANWETGEPNQFRGSEEDCVAMYGNDGNKWNDFPCSSQFKAFCASEPSANVAYE
jgi:hypothetical protein